MARSTVALSRRIALIAVLALSLFVVAGCGDDDSDSGGTSPAPSQTTTAGGASAGVEEAKQRIADAQQPLEFTAAGGPFDMAQNKGKKVFFVATLMAIPYVATLAEHVKEAGEAAGIEVVIFDGMGSPATQAKGIQTAIAQKADGIILQAVDPKLVANAVKDAADAGIPMIDANNGQPDDPTPAGIFGHVTPSTEKEGALQIDYAIANTDGKVTATMFNAPFFTVFQQRVKAMEKEVAELCPDCDFSVKDTDPSKPTEIPSIVASVLRSKPDTNWVFPAFDSQMPQILQGLRLAQADDKVRIVGSDNTPDQMKLLLEADNPFVADSGNEVGWQGWAEIDLIGRAMAGEEPASYELPLRMFTKDNPPSVADGNWTGADYVTGYKELWGTGS